jgi:hypothetical protein
LLCDRARGGEQRAKGGVCHISSGTSTIIACCFDYCYSPWCGQGISYDSSSTQWINRSAFLSLGQVFGSPEKLGLNTGIYRGTATVETGFDNFTACKIATAQAGDGAVSGGPAAASVANFHYIDVRNCSGRSIIKVAKGGDSVRNSIFFYNTITGQSDSGIVCNSGSAITIQNCIFRGNSGNLIPGNSNIFTVQNCWADAGAQTGMVASGWTIGTTTPWDVGVAPDVCGAIPEKTPTRTQSPRPSPSRSRTRSPSPTETKSIPPSSQFTSYSSAYARAYSLFRFGAFTWFLEPAF